MSGKVAAIAGVFSVICMILIFMATVPVQTATTNVAGWMDWVGVSDIPSFLTRRGADFWTALLGLVGAVTGARIAFLNYRILHGPREEA